MRQQVEDMVVNSELASRFILQYKRFLLFVYHEEMKCDDGKDLLEKMSEARDHYSGDKVVIDTYMKIEKNDLDTEMMEAIATVSVSTWVYLRDTTKHSIFVNPEMSRSYAVVGLTDPIKSIFGFSGAALKTGVVTIGGRYVCDGLMSSVVQFGKNYKNEFNDMYKGHKANGMFFK